MKNDPPSKRIAVIGAGFGGMALAARLAHAGFEVDVFERASQPGGKAGQFSKDGFRFDTGPTVLTMRFALERLYEDLGESWPETLRLIPQELPCRYFFPDATRLDAWQDAAAFGRELERHTTDSADALQRYFSYTRQLYEISAPVFLFSPFPSRKTLFSPEARKSFSNPLKLDVFRSMHRANTSFFNDPRSLMLVDRFATYNGSNPYRAPATLNQIFHVEHGLGAHTIEGGIFNLSTHLFRLAKAKGATFHFGTRVEKILTREKRAAGVRVEGDDLSYDAVVSNADVLATHLDLIEPAPWLMRQRYEWLGLSSSALVFYWGVKGNTPTLPLNAIFFGPRYKNEFIDISRKRRCPEDPTVYVHLSCRTNPGDAPPEHENWFVMVNAPPDAGQDWQAQTAQTREAILRRLTEHGITLTDRILFEQVLTPPMIHERTASYRGSLYGLSSNRMVSAFLRHPARARRFERLYFCGGSVHPGGGMPLAILSANLAFDALREDMT